MAQPMGHFQTAAWLQEPKAGARLQIRNDIEIPIPQEHQVLIKLECSGMCFSDIHSIYNETPMETDIAGHEGVGHVVQIGASVSDALLHARCGVRWHYSVCDECEICAVNSVACPRQQNSGRNVRGTFAQYICAPAKHITLLPERPPAEVLAPLLCAGLTMYSAIAKAELKPGNFIVIPGAGGGLGHLAVQIAAGKGYKVIAIDSGSSKRSLCLDLGATKFIDFATEDVENEVKAETGGLGAHAVVVSAGSEKAYSQGLAMLRNLGTLVCVGIPKSDFPLPVTPFQMIVRCLRVVGSSCGTVTELNELLDLAVKGRVRPRITMFDLDEINTVIDRLERFQIDGRAVLRIPQ